MTDTGQHDGRFYGAIIRVADLGTCRAFYQDVIGLGPPVVDSSFWVEFQIAQGQMVLALQQAPVAPCSPGPPARNVAWCLETLDLETFVRRLERDNVHPQRVDRSPCGLKTLTFLDPEGNPFVILESAHGRERGRARAAGERTPTGADR